MRARGERNHALPPFLIFHLFAEITETRLDVIVKPYLFSFWLPYNQERRGVCYYFFLPLSLCAFVIESIDLMSGEGLNMFDKSSDGCVLIKKIDGLLSSVVEYAWE